MVGNVMIDVLLVQLPAAKALEQPQKMGLQPGQYLVLTMHRPSNVDEPGVLKRLVRSIVRISKSLPVIFPVHPRTRARLDAAGLWGALKRTPAVRLVPPLGYLEFLSLTSQARVIVTDSGGLQEESTVLGIPCLTLRENTERPITVTEGTSTLVGRNPELLVSLVQDVLGGRYKQGSVPKLWDGRAAQRIAKNLVEFLT
jgi:UDP-N-acetylglucosamine 2-epimerase (non-hydrolysing)